MKLPKAKTYALEMVKGVRPGKLIADTIGPLHRLRLDVEEPMPEVAQVWLLKLPIIRPCIPGRQSLRKAQWRLLPARILP